MTVGAVVVGDTVVGETVGETVVGEMLGDTVVGETVGDTVVGEVVGLAVGQSVPSAVPSRAAYAPFGLYAAPLLRGTTGPHSPALL